MESRPGGAGRALLRWALAAPQTLTGQLGLDCVSAPLGDFSL